MSDLHKEHHFETEICEALATQGWLYAEGDAARRYLNEHKKGHGNYATVPPSCWDAPSGSSRHFFTKVNCQQGARHKAINFTLNIPEFSFRITPTVTRVAVAKSG